MIDRSLRSETASLAKRCSSSSLIFHRPREMGSTEPRRISNVSSGQVDNANDPSRKFHNRREAIGTVRTVSCKE